jgi:L-alanine-DL-glutamate epimerase-like enolase superfamily enzyme
MRIGRVEIIESAMPKEDPSWRFALGGSPVSEGFVLRVEADDGTEGYGYCASAFHYGISVGGLRDALTSFAQRLEGRDPFDREAILDELDHVLHQNYQAKAAVDIALHDLAARALGVPVYQLIGGLVREAMPVLRIVALKEPEEMALNAQKLVDQGYQYLKVKIGGDRREDVARVAAIRRQVGPDVHITLDANQSYGPKEAIRAIRQLEEYDIDLVEQPVRADDFDGLAAVTRATETIIEADESAKSLSDVFRLLQMRAADSISIKLMKLGGIRNAKLAAGMCQAAGVRCRVGAAVGSRIVNAACVHYVASTPNVGYACEVGEFARLLNDPAEGLEIQGGVLRVPHGPGLGVSVRQRAAIGA